MHYKSLTVSTAVHSYWWWGGYTLEMLYIVLFCICDSYYEENNCMFTNLGIDWGKSVFLGSKGCQVLFQGFFNGLYKPQICRFKCKNTLTVTLSSSPQYHINKLSIMSSDNHMNNSEKEVDEVDAALSDLEITLEGGKTSNTLVPLHLLYQSSCVCVVSAGRVYRWARPFLSRPCGEVCCHLW